MARLSSATATAPNTLPPSMIGLPPGNAPAQQVEREIIEEHPILIPRAAPQPDPRRSALVEDIDTAPQTEYDVAKSPNSSPKRSSIGQADTSSAKAMGSWPKRFLLDPLESPIERTDMDPLEPPIERMDTSADLEAKGKEYKSVLKAMKQYEKLLTQTHIAALRSQGTKGELFRALHEIEEQISSLPAQQQASLRLRLDGEKALLRKVMDDADRFRTNFNREMMSSDGYTLQQAMELARCGIKPSKLIVFSNIESNIKSASSDKGAFNKVSIVTLRDGTKKVLKPERAQSKSSPLEGTLGIPENHSRLGNRNLATREVDRWLGTNLVPNADYTIYKGRLHLAMDFAEGISGAGIESVTELHASAVEYRDIKASLKTSKLPSTRENIERAAGDFNLRVIWKEKFNIGSPGNFKSLLNRLLPQTDSDHETDSDEFVLHKVTQIPYDIDYRDPLLARAMCNAELLDYITGQGDRHSNNYKIQYDSNMKFADLKLIDNDACFGSKTDPEIFDRKTNTHYRGIGMPTLFDRASVEKFKR
ncbi:MAG: hypothetical protein U1E53_15875 [Dongiaceae bacterium]